MNRLLPVTGMRLLLPAVIPSWRFFDTIAASPRLDYHILSSPDDPIGDWQEFRPRPAVLSLGMMLRRLLWNAQWNENLFLVSLAERLMKSETEATVLHSQRELLLRVARHLERHDACGADAWLQIRLRFLGRAGPAEEIASEIVYLSSPFPIAELRTR